MGVVALFIGSNWWAGTMPLGWKLIGFWFAASLLCAVAIGAASGAVTGFLSARYDMRGGTVTGSDKAIGYAWVSAAVLLTLLLCRLIFSWMY